MIITKCYGIDKAMEKMGG